MGHVPHSCILSPSIPDERSDVRRATRRTAVSLAHRTADDRDDLPNHQQEKPGFGTIPT